MKTLAIFLLLFLCIGLFAREYTLRVRLLLIATIVGVVLYVSLK